MVAGAALKERMKEVAGRVDAYLREYLETLTECPPRLKEAMAYSLLGPGKRVRPALVLFCCEAAGGSLGQVQAAMAPGAAIEMIHCFSLIHDDLPAMDDDDLRRGRPTNHKVFGEALAILAGDALNTLPFELIVTRVGEARLAAALVRELAQATGAEGMIGGQVLDTCHPEEAKAGVKGTLEHLQRIHRMKTGALIRCACRMGGLCAGADGERLEVIDRYGRAIGLAFQIMDDILDVTATAEQMGKATGKDAAEGKLTYPVLVGLERSRALLAEQVEIAGEMAGRLGEKAGVLSEMAREMGARRS